MWHGNVSVGDGDFLEVNGVTISISYWVCVYGIVVCGSCAGCLFSLWGGSWFWGGHCCSVFMLSGVVDRSLAGTILKSRNKKDNEL